MIIAGVVVARTMIGNHFKKKFSKRPPPGIIVKTVEQRNFQNKIETFGTAVPLRVQSYNIEKYEILEPIKFNKKVKAGEVIVKLKNRNIVAPFDGVIGKRNFSDDIKVSESSLVINLEDASILYVDVDIPEIYATYVKEGLKVDVKFSIIFWTKTFFVCYYHNTQCVFTQCMAVVINFYSFRFFFFF